MNMEYLKTHWKLHWLKYILGIVLIICIFFYFITNFSNATSFYQFSRKVGFSYNPPTGSFSSGFLGLSSLDFDSQGNMYTVEIFRVLKINKNDGSVIKRYNLFAAGISYLTYIAVDKNNNSFYVGGTCLNTYAMCVFKFDSDGNFLYNIGSSGSGPGQIDDRLQGLVVDSIGNLYVLSGAPYNRVQKFDSNGNYLTSFDGSGGGLGTFNWPYGIAVDSQDNVYISDYYNQAIQKFSSSTSYISSFSTPGLQPGNIAVDSDYNAYFQDDTTGYIYKYNSSGVQISSFGGYSTGDADLQSEYPGVKLGDDGNLYISDFVGIKVFDLNGNFIRSYSGPKKSNYSSNGYSQNPYSVALDAYGSVYIPDYNGHRIQKFDSNGNFVMKFGVYGTSDGQLNYPYGVAVDSSGFIYVSDYSNRIQKFDSSGNFVRLVAAPGSGDLQVTNPTGLFIDTNNNLFVADSGNNRIQKFDSNGNFVMKFGTPGNLDGEMSGPSDVFVDDYGNIFVADSGNNRIQKFDSSGNFVMKFGAYGFGDGEFLTVTSVAVNKQGNVYGSDIFGDKINVYDSVGNYVGNFSSFGFSDDKINLPSGIRVDNNNIYIVSQSSGNVAVWSLIAPLLISSTSTSVTSNSATITWTTSDPSSSQVEFGVSSSLGSTTPITNTSPLVSNHSVTINGLPSCTTFQYRVISTSTSVTTRSSTSTFTTLGCTGMSQVLSTNEVKASSTATSTVSLEVIALTIPPEVATNTEIVFQAKKLEPVTFFEEAKTPTGKIAVGTSVFNLTAIDTDTNNKVSTFSKPILISTTYSPSDLNGIDPNTLSIYRYDGSSWFPLSDCSTNTDTHTVSCYTSNFSDFALFATPIPSTNNNNNSNSSAGGLILPPNAQVGDTKTNTVTLATNPVQQAINSLNNTTLNLTRNLRRGMSGTDVSSLQQYLAAIPGIYPEALITGYFGNLTYKAVKRYQCQYNIVCQGTEGGTGWGSVGPRTRGMMNR